MNKIAGARKNHLRIQLSSEQLRLVHGGDDAGTPPPVATEHEVVSPRDHASGLPTGQRMHKPFVIT
jgi:hypothetical protein